jgi:hypothetical protein
MEINPNDQIARVPKIAQRLFDGRMLVITPDDSRLHRFNETGTFIWQLVEKPKRVAAIAAAVVDNFDDVDEPAAMHHTLEFLTDMLAKKLVTLTPGKGA